MAPQEEWWLAGRPWVAAELLRVLERVAVAKVTAGRLFGFVLAALGVGQHGRREAMLVGGTMRGLDPAPDRIEQQTTTASQGAQATVVPPVGVLPDG